MPEVTTSHRAVSDTTKQFGAQLVVGLSAVLFAAWLNRMLPAKDLALWPICTSLGGVVAAFGSFGMGDTFVRRVPAMLARGERAEAGAILRTGLAINFVACAAISVALYLLAEEASRYLLHDVTMTPSVRSMALAAFLMSLSERLSWALAAVQDFGKRAVINLVTGVLRTPLAAVLCVVLGGGRGVVVALTFISLLSCLLSAFWILPHLAASRRFAAPGGLLRFSLPFYGVALNSLASGRVNQLVIALFVKPEVLAAYFVASSVAGYLDTLDRFAVESVTPKLAEKSARQSCATEATRVFRKCTRYVFLYLLPLHVAVAVAATPLVRLYGGGKYADAGLVLSTLSIGLLGKMLYQLHRAHIQVLAKPMHLFSLSLLQSLQNIGALVLLVPPLGALGAALSDGLVDASQGVISAFLLRRTMSLAYDLAALRLAATGAAAAASVLWLCHPLSAGHASLVLLALAAAGVVYMGSLTRRLSQEDADILLRVLPLRLRETGPGARLARGARWLLVKTEAVPTRQC